MAQAFKLPDLGEGIHEGEIVSVLVSVGDQVTEGQPILEVETDKAGVEIPSPFTGTVEEIRVKPEDVVKVGTVLLVIGDGGTGERGNGGTRGRGDGETRGHEGGATRGQSEPVGAGFKLAPTEGAHSGPVPASPSTRRLARELGVDLRQVPGTGRGGVVTADDVRAFAEKWAAPSEAASAPDGYVPPGEAQALVEAEPAPPEAPDGEAGLEMPAAVALPPLPDFTRWGPVERVRMRSVRRATARHMSLAWSQIPHAAHQESVDVTALEQFRRRYAPEVEAAGGKLTLTVFVLKAAVAALKAHPQFNASLDPRAEEIILKRYYHIGVAVDSERGLVVPVLRDVDRKSLAELSSELKALAERLRSSPIGLEEMQGGTFTVTNIGPLGGTGFVPIVNYPQVAILGMGRARLQPVVLGDESDYQIVPRLIMPLVLGFDHRVVDGADAARFVRSVMDLLENPERLWLRI